MAETHLSVTLNEWLQDKILLFLSISEWLKSHLSCLLGDMSQNHVLQGLRTRVHCRLEVGFERVVLWAENVDRVSCGFFNDGFHEIQIVEVFQEEVASS